MNWLFLIFSNFSVFFGMLFFVKLMLLERTVSRICLMFALAVWIFEWIRTRFILLGFKLRRVSLLISFTTPHKLAIMDSLVGAIIFDTFCSLDFAHTWYMTPFPIVFTLRYSRVHIGTTNCDDKTFDIEPPVDKALCFCTTLSILDVNPDNNHVGLGGTLWWLLV